MILKVEDALKSLRRTDPDCKACRDQKPTIKYRFKLFSLAALFILIGGCSRAPVYTSNYQEERFEIDGSDKDWKGKMYYDQDAKIMYGISNNSEKFLVKMKIIDPAVIRKILATGMTLWIDTVGKSKKQLGLTFPVKMDRNRQAYEGMQNNNERSNQMPDRRGGLELAMVNQRFSSGIAPVKLTGFHGKGETFSDLNFSSFGINAMIQINDDESLIYEACIPLDLLFNNTETFLNDSTKYFSYGFETGYIEMSAQGGRGMSGGTGGGGRGGGGGRSPVKGGGGGNMNSDRMTEMQQMTTPSKVWVKKARLSNYSY